MKRDRGRNTLRLHRHASARIRTAGAPRKPSMENRRNPWTTLSSRTVYDNPWIRVEEHDVVNPNGGRNRYGKVCFKNRAVRSEEHTSELQSRENLVCRLLLEKKKK